MTIAPRPRDAHQRHRNGPTSAARATGRNCTAASGTSPRSRPASPSSRSSPRCSSCSASASASAARPSSGPGRSSSPASCWSRCASPSWRRGYPISGAIYQWSRRLARHRLRLVRRLDHDHRPDPHRRAPRRSRCRRCCPHLGRASRSSADPRRTRRRPRPTAPQNAVLLGCLLLVVTTVVNVARRPADGASSPAIGVVDRDRRRRRARDRPALLPARALGAVVCPHHRRGAATGRPTFRLARLGADGRLRHGRLRHRRRAVARRRTPRAAPRRRRSSGRSRSPASAAAC